jgi:hypothetical protein
VLDADHDAVCRTGPRAQRGKEAVGAVSLVGVFDRREFSADQLRGVVAEHCLTRRAEVAAGEIGVDDRQNVGTVLEQDVAEALVEGRMRVAASSRRGLTTRRGGGRPTILPNDVHRLAPCNGALAPPSADATDPIVKVSAPVRTHGGLAERCRSLMLLCTICIADRRLARQ